MDIKIITSGARKICFKDVIILAIQNFPPIIIGTKISKTSPAVYLFFSFLLLAYLTPRNGIIFANAEYMKTIVPFLVSVALLAACSTSKSSTEKKTSTAKVTKQDLMKGGTSFDNAVILRVKTESAGVAEEYKWLAESYPGYSMIRKTQTSRGNKHYDIITFKTRDGIEKNAYFDITSFYKK